MFGLVTDAIEWWVKARGDENALVLGEETVTYSQLDQWTSCVAADLASRGIEPGDVVGLSGANSIEWCIAAIGAIKAGAIVAPFSYRFTVREIEHLVRDCAPKAVFTDETQGEKLQAVAAAGAEFQQIALSEVAALRHAAPVRFHRTLSPSAPIVIVYTSGTTGKPKGVVYTHQTTLAFITEIVLKDPCPPEDLKVLFTLPLFTLGGILYGLLMTFVRGGLIVVMPGFEAQTALEAIIRHRISFMTSVPVIWQQIADLPNFSSADLSHLKFAIVGGARVPVPLLEAYRPRGVVLRQLYGMTEVGGFGTIPRPKEALERPDCCGDGSIFTKVKVVRPDGAECEPEEVGEILMSGPAVTPGYWNNQNATDELIRDGWIYSGDLGSRNERGLLKFVDRKKDMIISGGFNISPTEIENIIGGEPGVNEVAVIPVHDAKWGETPAAVVYTQTKIDIPNIVRKLNDELADFKVPRYIIAVDAPCPACSAERSRNAS